MVSTFWPKFIQQKLNRCCANVGQMLNGVLKWLQLHAKFSRAKEMLILFWFNFCWMHMHVLKQMLKPFKPASRQIACWFWYLIWMEVNIWYEPMIRLNRGLALQSIIKWTVCFAGLITNFVISPVKQTVHSQRFRIVWIAVLILFWSRDDVYHWGCRKNNFFQVKNNFNQVNYNYFNLPFASLRELWFKNSNWLGSGKCLRNFYKINFWHNLFWYVSEFKLITIIFITKIYHNHIIIIIIYWFPLLLN